MGFFSRIKDKLKGAASKVVSTAKKVFNKADTEVGGFLPGGRTPAEVKASKAVQKPAPKVDVQKSVREAAEIKKFGKVQKEPTKLFSKAGVREVIKDPVKSIGELSGVNTLQPQHYLAAVGLTAPVKNIAVASANFLTSKLSTIGKSGLKSTTSNTADTIASNTVTEVATKSWLSKLVTSAKSPVVVVSALVGAIGSYPFAGFIKEEALQTIGFATRSAIQSGDIEGADEAIELQKQILDPSLWSEIKSKIPYVNVLSSLDDFYKSAQVKLSVDEKIVRDLKVQVETGETDDARWARVRAEEVAQDTAAVDYYNQERRLMVEWELEAREAASVSDLARFEGAREKQRQAEIKARNADAVYWAKQQERQRELEAADRKAIADFWSAYRKQAQKMREDSSPSHLNFGLI